MPHYAKASPKKILHFLSRNLEGKQLNNSPALGSDCEVSSQLPCRGAAWKGGAPAGCPPPVGVMSLMLMVLETLGKTSFYSHACAKSGQNCSVYNKTLKRVCKRELGWRRRGEGKVRVRLGEI